MRAQSHPYKGCFIFIFIYSKKLNVLINKIKPQDVPESKQNICHSFETRLEPVELGTSG